VTYTPHVATVVFQYVYAVFKFPRRLSHSPCQPQINTLVRLRCMDDPFLPWFLFIRTQ
jgi:hypothetical protein